MTEKRSICFISMLIVLKMLTACAGGAEKDVNGGEGTGGSSASTYSVGGIVSGIKNGGLVLQNNGGDNLSISANGSFSFAMTLADKADYDVTVLTAPSSQTCTVTHGSGTIAAANVGNITVSCVDKAFGIPALVETNNGDAALSPQIAVDAEGNALAVWHQSDGTRYNVWANRYSAETSAWGTTQLLETDNVGAALSPQIAVDAEGNALAVWHQSDGVRNNIWSNRFSTGPSTWGTAELIEIGNAGSAFSPQIAFDSNGNALALWSQSDGTRYNIWSNRFSSGTQTWGTAVPIETDNAGDASFPQIAIDANGNALAVWSQSDGVRYNIWSNRFSAGTNTWGTATLIETDNAGNASLPQIAVDAEGNALAVWHESDGTLKKNIWSNRYSTGTNTWGTATLIETDNAGDASFPQIAIDTNGNALAVWNQSDGVRYNIWSNRYSTGTNTWGTATLAETDNAGETIFPQIAIDPNGDALAVWSQSDGVRYNIWSNRFSAGTNTWGTATLIETDNAGNASLPQIAVDAEGNALAIWEQSDGTRSSIWANRYQ